MSVIRKGAAADIPQIAAIYDRVTPEQYNEIEQLVDVFDEEHTIDEYVEADYNFHNMLIEITGNPMLIQVNNMIAQMRRDLLYRMFSHPEIIQDARFSHRQIFNCLKAKDRNACISAVADHISTTRERIKSVY